MAFCPVHTTRDFTCGGTPPQLRSVRRMLTFAPQPTHSPGPLPGGKPPFGRSMPPDRSRSALAVSHHLDGFLPDKVVTLLQITTGRGSPLAHKHLAHQTSWPAMRPLPRDAHTLSDSQSASPATSLWSPGSVSLTLRWFRFAPDSADCRENGAFQHLGHAPWQASGSSLPARPRSPRKGHVCRWFCSALRLLCRLGSRPGRSSNGPHEGQSVAGLGLT